MKKSRLITLALALTLLLPAFIGRAGEAEKPLVVASVTKMNGMFSTNMWGNNTADVDMRLLLHGHSLFYQDVGQQEHLVNKSVVRDLEERVNEDGSKTFTITLQPYLVYNNGSPINARDYVFSILLTTSDYIQELGGSPVVMHFLKGSAEYEGDPSIPFSGVRLLAYNKLELTFTPEVSKETKLFQYINFQPYPYAVIAPGCTIEDDGQGAYIKGPWTADLLRTTLLDPVTGYLSHPMITSGPYSLVSYDYDTGVAELEINRNFFGDPYGNKPTIQHLRYEPILNRDILGKLRSGEVDVVNKVSSNDIVQSALEDTGLDVIDYSREGVAYLTFAMERPLPSLLGVRKALALSIHTDAIINDFLGDRGTRVFGFYGSSIALSAEWENLVSRIPRYEYNLEEATQALEAEGFVYDEKGNLYDPAVGGIRYRLGNPTGAAPAPANNAPDATATPQPSYQPVAGNASEVARLVPLSITIGITPDNDVANHIVEQMEVSLPQIGAQLNVTMMDMPVLLTHYYRQVPRTCDLYFLGSNFMKDFAGNPSGYSPEAFDLRNNPSALVDPVLADLTRKLREAYTTSPTQYKLAWFQYQTQLARMLPIIPLYTNTYSDIYSASSGLAEYHPDKHWSWAEAIVYAHK